MARKVVSMKLDEKVLEWVDQKAKERITSRTAVVMQALIEAMEVDSIVQEMGGRQAVMTMMLEKALKKGEEKK